MRTIGYARSAPFDQNLDDQRHHLAAAGCEVVFDETGDGVSSDLPGLHATLSGLDPGDA